MQSHKTVCGYDMARGLDNLDQAGILPPPRLKRKGRYDRHTKNLFYRNDNTRSFRHRPFRDMLDIKDVGNFKIGVVNG